jgi:hypothetical protein
VRRREVGRLPVGQNGRRPHRSGEIDEQDPGVAEPRDGAVPGHTTGDADAGIAGQLVEPYHAIAPVRPRCTVARQIDVAYPEPVDLTPRHALVAVPLARIADRRLELGDRFERIAEA